jgi:hypothetical protein
VRDKSSSIEYIYGILAPLIHWPLDLGADDVVDPIGGDEEDPVFVLCSRGYLERLVLSQLVRDLRERAFLASSRLS